MASAILLSLMTVTTLVTLIAGQNQHFFSNPTLSPPTLVVDTNNAALTEPGYIFMAPFQDAQPSPLIFDSNGTLIWDGLAFVAPVNAHDLTMCNYQGTPHLCFVDAAQFNGYARGHGVILDSTYTIVREVSSGNNQPGLDQHEFRIQDGSSSVLATIYKQIPYNGSEYGMANVTWLSIGIFQEIDVATGNVLFEWQTIDHVPINQSYVLPGTTDISGDGLTQDTAWDYFHINSVDKDPNGDYLVSGRHVKTIFKISGVTGSILWQLGGKSSSFTTDYTFNFQHNARYLAETDSTTTISLYDNGSDDAPPPSGQSKPGYEAFSSGMVVSIDTVANTSTLMERYISPGRQLSDSQGNLQSLPSGNKFMGMGSVHYAVEFTTNATGNAEVVFYAHLNNTDGRAFSSYRNYKFPWSAQPAAPPDLFVYAQNCSAAPVFYASWNGATEVASWRFRTRNGTTGPSSHVGTVPKSGFETSATFAGEGFALFAVAQALDAWGGVLGESEAVRAFVPAGSLGGCDGMSCGTSLNYTSAPTTTCHVPIRGVGRQGRVWRYSGGY